ncbi:unnamed protein product [Didymodactylos carnosus]|uniref:Serine aminopeptidase S33 domain-containing protein n=1 Tax=Didymodactylos carnosus TaxID=1234261 RepID=A0A813SWE6_9BILA|nr:unnamed protein product [Didymodactylos carnosus]CAF0817571.1 unnamed protein product [Didymodactylos carnosus]CAF3588041.1 unnamed protein product [Didymodactylos carnosus]CAF3601680.1 unnamed protein product [Didymodactylos carnosus]
MINEAAKLAFLPPEPTYTLHANNLSTSHTNGTHYQQQQSPNNDVTAKYSMNFFERAEWQHTNAELSLLEPYFVTTSRNNRIACLYVKCVPNPKYYIFYDYSGYGASQGKASEKNMYCDIEAAYQSLKQRYHLRESQIILYGQSIGTVPVVDLASRHGDCCSAVILHSPLTSGMRVAFPDTKRTWCCDAFSSIDKIHRIRSIVLIIHGTEDDVIDVSHGFALYSKLQNSIEPLWVEGGGHNDIEAHGQYVERLLKLIDEEVPQLLNQQQQTSISHPQTTQTQLGSTLIIPATVTTTNTNTNQHSPSTTTTNTNSNSNTT